MTRWGITGSITLVLAVAAASAYYWFNHRESEEKQMCGPGPDVYRILTENGELPVVVLNDENPKVMHVIFVNHELQTWTIVRTVNDGSNMVCVDSLGRGIKILSQKPMNHNF